MPRQRRNSLRQKNQQRGGGDPEPLPEPELGSGSGSEKEPLGSAEVDGGEPLQNSSSNSGGWSLFGGKRKRKSGKKKARKSKKSTKKTRKSRKKFLGLF
jgi:hypothetical protein